MSEVILDHITKTYNKGKITAVNDVSLAVGKGELFGLIGPDGAGKTTIFRILTTLLIPDSGKALVEGFDTVADYKKLRKRVGYMPGRFSLYQDLSVEENLNFFATVFNTTIEENYHLIKDIYTHIEPFKTRKAKALSGGMKQKLALCCALIHKPTVLFLDEPTTGVDPVSRKEFWEMLKNLKREGITILVSTPYMDEAMLCDRIALMMNGKILKIDTPDGIINQFGKNLWSVHSKNMHALLNDLRENENFETCFAFGDRYHVTLKNPAYPMSDLEVFLSARGHTEITVLKARATIEDCFMELGQEQITQLS